MFIDSLTYVELVLASLWAEDMGDIILELSFMVHEYVDLFLNNLVGLPADREVEFGIDLLVLLPRLLKLHGKSFC